MSKVNGKDLIIGNIDTLKGDSAGWDLSKQKQFEIEGKCFHIWSYSGVIGKKGIIAKCDQCGKVEKKKFKDVKIKLQCRI